MRLISYVSTDGPRLGAVKDDGVVDLNLVDPEVPTCVISLLMQGPEGMLRARTAAEMGNTFQMESVKLLPPVAVPEKVICIGLNYADHAEEGGAEIPSEPVVFAKVPTALCTHGDSVVLPRACCKVDYEAELVVVIGQECRHVPIHRAHEVVAGYCCGNDISARDWQLERPGGQWFLGKSFDSFAPYGPTLVTADEVNRPNSLRVQLRLNGEIMQDSSTSEMIFSIEKLVSHLSSVFTLKPGDLIFTGTPAGVGCTRVPPVFLQPGDVVEVEIEKLGILSNLITDEDE